MSAQLASADVIEVFSPERVGKACKQFGFEQGLAMDIKSGYDFDFAAAEATGRPQQAAAGLAGCTAAGGIGTSA